MNRRAVREEREVTFEAVRYLWLTNVLAPTVTEGTSEGKDVGLRCFALILKKSILVAYFTVNINHITVFLLIFWPHITHRCIN